MAGYADRLMVPADFRDWKVPYPDYNPPEYTDSKVLSEGVAQGWADPTDPGEVDFKRRPSHGGAYRFDPNTERPLNPAGRTGISGRGLLGKWGPNYAADPVIFVRDKSLGGLGVLLVQRNDTGKWALPGGMVDAGEAVSTTARRELEEETGVDASDLSFEEVYSGRVDKDFRNTDHSWMETVASAALLSSVVVLHPQREEVRAAQWTPIDVALGEEMYADHAEFVIAAMDKLHL